MRIEEIINKLRQDDIKAPSENCQIKKVPMELLPKDMIICQEMSRDRAGPRYDR